MENLFICRTCLQSNLSKYIKIFNNIEPNQMPIKDMLEIFMPEMDLDIFEGEIVMCLECAEALKNAYIFKNKCLKTEERIYDYLHHYNIKLGKKISLSSIGEHNVTKANFSQVTSIPGSSQSGTLPDFISNKSITSANNSDSNQCSAELCNTDTTDHSQTVSKSDEKKKLPPQRTKKRKRACSTKKHKKSFDCNSLKRSYTCDLCEYKAYRVDLLNTHKQKHDRNVLTVKEYKCDLCLYSTLRKRALDRHLFTHKGKSQHLCEVCNKTFAENYQLKLHSITHTGQELPHKCKECGKGYLTKSYLKQHFEIRHLAKDKEICEECPPGKCEHSLSRCYKCNMCESSFSDKRGLDAHKFTHTKGELPYKCLHCNFSTAWKGNLKKHLQNKH